MILSDRIPVVELAILRDDILTAMRQWGIGRVDERDKVSFCGIVQLAHGPTVVFLPRRTETGNPKLAALTMKALARYGNDAQSREFENDTAPGNSGLLSVIRHLATDFQHHGIFSERMRIRGRNSGKPDWRRTVSNERSILLDDGSTIYTDLATTKSIDSNETPLAQIQAVVLAEILDAHGWWLDGALSRRNELRLHKRPHQKRALWPVQLDALLPRLYSSRAIFLATYLAYYLRNSRGSGTGSFVFGVEDFHTVWETMLRQTLAGSEDGWNKKLPKPVYQSKEGGRTDAPQRGMQTDIILRHGTSYTLADAKYYDAISPDTAPGWPDIAKQMFYEKALRHVVGAKAEIRNCFVFPSSKTAHGPLSRVRMHGEGKDGDEPDGFTEIECVYMDTASVLAAYCAREKNLSLPEPQIIPADGATQPV